MRNRTQQRIEDIARERGRNPIDLALVEEGIEQGRKLMEEMIQGYKGESGASARSLHGRGKTGRGGVDKRPSPERGRHHGGDGGEEATVSGVGLSFLPHRRHPAPRRRLQRLPRVGFRRARDDRYRLQTRRA